MTSIKETIYKVANAFDTYKNKISSDSDYEDSIGIDECHLFNSSYLDGVENEHEKICEQVIRYLSHLKESSSLFYRDQGCRYLCYWIHHEVLKDLKPIDNTINLYKEFLKKYEEYDEYYKFEEYLKNFNSAMLENFLKLIELYGKFNLFIGRKSTCRDCDCADASAKLFNNYVDDCYLGNDNDFCDELENFKNTYENYMRSAECPESVTRILPPIKRYNTATIVSIPFAIILVISIFLPLLYKFTPFGPWIHQRIGKNQNMWNNIIQEENHLLDNYEMKKDDSKKQYYKLLYNSS